MTGRKKVHLGVSVPLVLILLGLPVSDVVAQSQAAKKSNRGRSSVRQAHQSRPPHKPSKPPSSRPPQQRPPSNRPPQARPPHKPSKPPSSRPPHQRPPSYRPPSYRPPRPRPPAYRPHPPRYRGRYYPSYSFWRAAVGAAAVITIGTILATPPPRSTIVIIEKKSYYISEGVYYEKVLHGDEVAYQVVHDPR